MVEEFEDQVPQSPITDELNLSPSIAAASVIDHKYRIVKTLIDNAGLPESKYLKIFQDNNISDSNIHEVDLNDIKRLFEDDARVVACSIYNALALWKRDNMNFVLSCKVTSANGSVRYKDVRHLIDIEAILKDDISGKKIIEQYQENVKITEVHRKMIIQIIVNFILQQNIEMEKGDFIEITSKILKFFSLDDTHAVSNYCFQLSTY